MSKDILTLSREAMLPEAWISDTGVLKWSDLERLVALVRADERNSWPAEMEAMERQVNILTDALAQEREACAKVCDETLAQHYMKQMIPARDEALFLAACADCAAAIRERSNK